MVSMIIPNILSIVLRAQTPALHLMYGTFIKFLYVLLQLVQISAKTA